MAEARKNRRHGNRKEGRLIRSLAPYNNFIPFVMPQRNESDVHFEAQLEVTEVDRWLRKMRTQGYKGLGMLHLLIAAYVRVVAEFPGVNRFISGQRLYARDTITVILTVKKEMKLDADETSIKVDFLPTDTIFDVYSKMNAAVDAVKAAESENDTDQVAAKLCKLPRLFLRFTIWFLKVLDYFDHIPMSLINASPFHGSMIITDMGSLGIPPVFHHLYNFGNIPIFVSFGSKYRKMEVNKDGSMTEHKYVDFKVVSDERITDGMYYSTAFRYLVHYMANPAVLADPPERVNQDID